MSQELHFKNVFEAGIKSKIYDPKVTELNHMMFGMILHEVEHTDEQGKVTIKQERMKTRSGETIKLIQLLDEARDRALKTFEERIAAQQEGSNKVQLGKDDIQNAAEVLGISSIKYYDLKQNRIQNYCFDFDKMLDAKGNTGVYLIYSYVRIKSILRKAGYDPETSNLADFDFKITNETEKALALTLLRMPEAIEMAAKDLMVNRVCDLLYDVS